MKNVETCCSQYAMVIIMEITVNPFILLKYAKGLVHIMTYRQQF